MTEAAFAALRARLARVLADGGHPGPAALLERLTYRPGDSSAAAPPVVTHLGDALVRAGEEVDAALAGTLAPLATAAAWQQTASYVQDPPDATFLDLYAHATLAEADDVALGLVLLGPGVHYPPHHHPAEEFYLPAGSIRWRHAAEGEPAPEPAGVLVHHAPWQPHAMTTGDRPVLLVYVWTGPVGTPSVFV
ncbi:dimethylsulfonioproprionate lyase family protein [Actinomycetospora sp. C-140]